ncbi:MAG: FecR family protein, partial [Ignavibacteriaceae bacterium]|nr:FecR family protein [Ignavibacteriaceae bacterium]
RYLLKIAASIIALLTLSVCALYISGVFSSNSNQVAWTERKTISGEKSIINFADGTKIILNGNSNLKYSVNALNNTREVFLEGEAFFEVKHDTTRQFIVHSKNLTTTDLGTEFDISAYSNEKEITVSLVSGKINIAENENEKISKSTILQPKQQLVYSTTKKTYNLRDFDMVEIIGWKDNVLKFKDATLKDVFIKLERAYGIKFQLQTKSFEGFLITANFDKAPVETVTKLIKKLTGLDYTNIKENDQIKKIVFFKK